MSMRIHAYPKLVPSKDGACLVSPEDTEAINTYMKAANDRLDALGTEIERLRAAVEDPGRNPGLHNVIMHRHRMEWPTLWKAIDSLITDPLKGE